MNQLTLGKFIQDEMKRRGLSIRQFAEQVDVTHKVIAKFRYHGLKDTYNKRPIGEPSLDFLAKLAKATAVDLCALVALIHPDATMADARAGITSARAQQLTPEQRELLDTFLAGLSFDHLDSHDNGIVESG